jgi:hypothetical protein
MHRQHHDGAQEDEEGVAALLERFQSLISWKFLHTFGAFPAVCCSICLPGKQEMRLLGAPFALNVGACL